MYLSSVKVLLQCTSTIGFEELLSVIGYETSFKDPSKLERLSNSGFVPFKVQFLKVAGSLLILLWYV